MILNTDDIWAELKRRRITATQVAKELGVAKSTVCRGINGDVKPRRRLLVCIASLLGVSVEELQPGRSSVSNLNPTVEPVPRSTGNFPENGTDKARSKVRKRSRKANKASNDAAEPYSPETESGVEAAA